MMRFKKICALANGRIALLLGAIIASSAVMAQDIKPSTAAVPANRLGEAFAQNSNRLLYRERHQYQLIPNGNGDITHDVYYTQPDGTPWAHKKLSYSNRKIAPDFKLTDNLNHETLQVSVNDNTIRISHNNKTAELPFDDKLPLVIDAGFDPFVRQQWQSLSAGEPTAFYFLLPRRAKLVELKLTPHSCKDFEPKSHLCLSLEINNWLLRLLVDPIELSYQRNDQRLHRYLGVSNLSFPDAQDSPQVTIHYETLDSL